MERPISPPRMSRGTGKTRYEKEVNASPKVADDPNERKWVGPWLMGDTIGKGASGRVRLARHKRTRKLAAIKIIPKVHIGAGRVDPKAERVMQSIRREMVVMKLIHHPNIMDMYDVYEDQDELYLLLEYVEGGELFDYLVSKGRLDIGEALNYFRQIISGVDYCHKFNICHRDLKPENLLLDKEKQIKIADFGMAALELGGGTLFLETSCGSPHYASPEIVAGKQYHGNASDIWSCGVVLFALLTGRLPFDHENMGELLRKVKAGRFEMPRNIPPEAKDLLARILVVDPSQRITMSNIIKHPFFHLSLSPNLPKFVSPSFSDAARVIASEDLIERPILENLTTLFRKVPQREIVAQLLSEKRTWEKAFYFLLKDYQERQEEEYGHGMSFLDYSYPGSGSGGSGQGREGRESAEDVSVMDMQRKRRSQMQLQQANANATAHAHASAKTGPTGTIRAYAPAHTQEPHAHTLVQPRTAMAPMPQAQTPPRAAGKGSGKGDGTGNSQSTTTPPHPPPVASRHAPPSPKDQNIIERLTQQQRLQQQAQQQHPTSRRRAALSGPRPHTAVKENSPAKDHLSDISFPSRHRGDQTPANPSALPPVVPGRSPARVAAAATAGSANATASAQVAGVSSSTGANADPNLSTTTGRPRARTVGAEKLDSPLPSTPIVAQSRTPDLNPAVTPAATTASTAAVNDGSDAKKADNDPATLIGLGLLELPTPPPLMDPPASPRLVAAAAHVTAKEKRLSLGLEVPSPQPQSPRPPASPRKAAHMSPTRVTRAHTDASSPRRTIVPLKGGDDDDTTPKRQRPTSLRLEAKSKASQERDKERAGLLSTTAGYPSPPPSQASSLEPFLALQQSPVFSERFSLHLDAMLLKTPKVQPVQDVAMDLDVATVAEGENEDKDDEAMDVDEDVLFMKHSTATPAQKQNQIHDKNTLPVDIVAQTPTSAPRLVEKRPRADTEATMAMGDWSFLGEIDEARQAVPFEAQVLGAGVNGKNVAKGAKQEQAPNAKRQGSGDSDVTMRQAPHPLTSTAPVASRPAPERRGSKVTKTKAQAAARMSTFVAAPPSPALTPTLEAVPTGGWFGQLFHVKPAAYVFHSQDNFMTTRTECANLLRSFGVSVHEVKNEGKYGILRCHVDYIQEPNGKMVVNKKITFRAQITPHFTVRSPVLTRTGSSASTTGNAGNSPRPSPAPPAETCTLSLVQEHGAKSTLEIIALRLRQEWSLDSMIEPQTPGQRPPMTPKASLF